MRENRPLLAAAAMACALTAPAARAQTTRAHQAATPSKPAADAALARESLTEVEQRLDLAVDRVSLPRPAALMGAGGARAYRLPGYGVVFVLTPRTLPGEGGSMNVLRPRHRVEIRRVGPRVAGEAPPELDRLEREVIVLQHETERTRRAAEEDMERIVQKVRVRVTPDGPKLEIREGEDPASDRAQLAAPRPPALDGGRLPGAEPPATPEPPAPALPAPPLPPLPPGAPQELPVAAAPVPPPPPPPPWKFWFEDAVPHDTRSADVIVADVRRSILGAFETGAGRLRGLRPEEFVTVAVDFEPAGLFVRTAPKQRTLVIRARVRDLEARARGTLAAEDLQKRIEVIEY